MPVSGVCRGVPEAAAGGVVSGVLFTGVVTIRSRRVGDSVVDKGRYVSLAGLRGRGWTPAIVRNLLGEPDLWGRNARDRAMPAVRLYGADRVEVAERGTKFAAARRAALRRGVATVREGSTGRSAALLAMVRATPIVVPRLAPRTLAERAVRHRNLIDEKYARGRAGYASEPATLAGADPAALPRWMVNYLRHALTRYDDLLQGLAGGDGREEAEALLRRRVYGAIAAVYPELGAECRRQLGEREGG